MLMTKKFLARVGATVDPTKNVGQAPQLSHVNATGSPIVCSDVDPDLYNKSRIRIRMERNKSGSGYRTYTVNKQKQTMTKN